MTAKIVPLRQPVRWRCGGCGAPSKTPVCPTCAAWDAFIRAREGAARLRQRIADDAARR